MYKKWRFIMALIPYINSPISLIQSNSWFVNRFFVNFGYIEDGPGDDLKYSESPMVTSTIETNPSLKKYFKPISNQYNIGSCHDDKTEVLTKDGWKLFKDVTLEDKLATINPETKELIYIIPDKLIRFYYKGDMVCGKNKYTLDFKVTPDHNMLIRKWNEKTGSLNDNYELIPAKDIGWYCGLLNRIHWSGNSNENKYTLKGLPDSKHKYNHKNIDIPIGTWLKFLGIYLAEGTIIKADSMKRKSSYRIQIAAFKEREKIFIKQVLLEMNIKATEYIDRFVINNKRLYFALKDLNLYAIKAYDKFVPSFVFEESSENIRLFLLGHFMGDGCEQLKHRCHYTSSPKLAEDIQRLIFLSGDESYLNSRPPRISTMKDGRHVMGKHNEYRISVCANKQSSIYNKKNISIEYYEGEVFCAEINPYHTLVTRRNNKILISGNCVANAVADSFEAQMAHRKGCDPSQIEDISRLFIYWNARNLSNPPTCNKDSGSKIRLAFDCMARYGAPTEKTYPYDTSKVNTRPTIISYREAIKNRISKFYRIDGEGTMRISQIKQALSSGNPVVFGTKIAESFRKVNSDAVITNPGGGWIGGHAMVIVGWSESKLAFEVRNSWGTDWGVNGYCWMDKDYIASNVTSDIWAATV